MAQDKLPPEDEAAEKKADPSKKQDGTLKTSEKKAEKKKADKKIRVLLVDDEERFRTSLADRLRLRGYECEDVGDGEEAIRRARQTRPDVILLDRMMPGMPGEEVLQEIKKITPTVQVIMLTGHGSMDSAAEAGRLDAFAYLVKPCDTDKLVETLEAAAQEKQYAMARDEIPQVDPGGIWTWLKGTNQSRPGFMILGTALFALMALMPVPQGLQNLLGHEKTGQAGESIAGYSSYLDMEVGQSVADYYSFHGKVYKKVEGEDGKTRKVALNAEEAGRKAMVMIGILIVAALFWASGALPIGFTALLVGVLMYAFGVFTPNQVASSFFKDSVFFVMGVLAFAVGIAKTGLDKRIGLVLLGTSRSIGLYLFVFCPLLAVTAAFLSEHALVAFLAPILMVVYMSAVHTAKVLRDPKLAVLLILAMCFAANQGGPGSPAAGGRNAIMIGILADYDMAPSFGEWVMYGLPFVPVCALCIAAYFFIAVRRRLKVKNLNVAAIVVKESKKIGKMTTQEYMALIVLIGVVTLWITASDSLGMGGPVWMGLVAMGVFRLIGWKDVNKISWDVVLLYGSATAMGVGLAYTGAALWMAKGFVSMLPDAMSAGEGLAIASAGITCVMTNIMSDGATVAAVGPITVPMATISGTPPLMVGLATAFASSFANVLIIGTPNNAMAYALAKDMKTGERLISLGDFFKHGLAVTLIAFTVLVLWTILGYWQWIGF